jgi:hypothetical protein
MKPDEIFVLALLLCSIALVAVFAIHSRRAAANAAPEMTEEAAEEPADVTPSAPPAARSAGQRRRRAEPAATRR